MKLKKVSEQHYIIVDDSEIKEGDLYWDSLVSHWENVGCLQMIGYVDKGKTIIQSLVGTTSPVSTSKKITHSTQPLEYVNQKLAFNKIKQLCLLEVEELIYGHSVENIAENAVGHLLNDEERKMGYIEGFNAHKELVKDKLLITNKDLFDFLYFAKTHSQYSDEAIVKEFIDKFLKEQDEWNIEFDENGKIKLI
jgi:hypothetical protein